MEYHLGMLNRLGMDRKYSAWRNSLIYPAAAIFFATVVFLTAVNTVFADDCAVSTSVDRFDINGNGTVTDIESGLTWMRCTVGQQWKKNNCAGQGKALSWQEAITYANSLNKNGGYASRSDWRLPRLNELASIAQLRCGPPRINTVLFPSTLPQPFWTINNKKDNESHIYTLSFGSTGVQVADASESHFLRLVRGRD